PVDPEPRGTSVAISTCSDIALNYDLQANINTNNGLASTFSWVAAADNASVTGESLAPVATAFITDDLINTSNVDQVVVYNVTPTSTLGTCTGDMFTVTVTVQPEPVGVAVAATRCSDVVLGPAFTLSTNGTSVSAASYTIAVNPNGLTQSGGTNSVGSGKASNEIADDVWNNQTGANVNVVYTVTPLGSNGCIGQPFIVTATIQSEPVSTAPIAGPSTCSDVAIGYNLTVSGASTYNISTNSNGLTQSGGTVSAGTGKAANELADDRWNNITLANVNVVYTITPVSPLGCLGDVFTVTVPIRPEPRGGNDITAICSKASVGYDLQVSNVNSLGNSMSSNFSWVAANNPSVSGESLGAQSGNIISDILVNVSSLDQVVIYTVTPTGTVSGCVGDNFTVRVTVKPEPVGISASKTVCSDVAVDYNLLVNVATVGNNVGATFSWIATNNPNVTGESTSAQAGPIITDVITNLTNVDQSVVYTVTPTGTNGCVGNNFLITITVRPEPVGLTTTVPDICSGTNLGYNLQNNVNTSGNNLPANFSWIAASNANVTGESTTVKTGPIIDDVLINTTTSNQTVVYTITPTGQTGGCVGNSFTITVTINPKVIFSAGPDLAVCVSDLNKALTGSVSFAPAGVSWSGGTGSFSDNTIPNPVYTLSASELAVTTPLNVTLTLTAFGSGACPNETDQMTLRVNPLPTVVFFGLPPGGPPPQIAENSPVLTLSGNQAGGLFTVSPGIGLGSTYLNPLDEALFDPDAATVYDGTPATINQLTYTYTDPNGCTNSQTQGLIVNAVTNVDFAIQGATLDASNNYELCAELGLVKLLGFPDPASGLPPETEFTAVTPGMTIVKIGPDYFIQTDGLASGTYNIKYTYKNAVNAISFRIRSVKIFASPVASFTSAGSCIDSPIVFTNTSSINPTPFPTSISSVEWNFGDGDILNGIPGNPVPPGTHGNRTSGMFDQPNHFYTTSMAFSASLRVTTLQGCSNSLTALTPIAVGDVPIADFKFSAICNNDSTKFESIITQLGISTVGAYNWDFGDGHTLSGLGSVPTNTNGGRTTGTYAKPQHRYDVFGNYNVSLSVTTNLSCNSLARIIPINIIPSQTVTVTSTTPPADFESGNEGWFAENLTDPFAATSWVSGPPSGATINSASSGNNVWWTGGNSGSYLNNENSVVNGLCYDLTQLSRPMISLDYWSDVENNVDGAVLQYSTDGGLNWSIIGPPVGQTNRDEGINWFNGIAIPSNPGEQLIGSYGWTAKQGGWKTGRFNLDMIPPVERDQVRIRIAFASNDLNPAGVNFDGFAFDNVFVGNKTRNVLVEHFTNNNLNASVTADGYINNLLVDQLDPLKNRTTSDFTDIRYHISFPTPDPINLENQKDPSARASYYNVSQPPVTIMDGLLDNNKFKGQYTDITRIEIDREALRDPQFLLQLDTIATGNPNTIEVQLTITADTAISGNLPLLAQVALVETNVSGNRNVVRKLLLGSDGLTINLTGGWAIGTQAIRPNPSAPVAIDVPVANSNNLQLVAWIQNKNTRRVYQSVVMAAPYKIGQVVVGIEDEPVDPFAANIEIYPNPANGKFRFGLPSSNYSNYQWKIADQRGVIVKSGNFMRTIDGELEVEVQELPNGVYFIAITGPNDFVSYRKLVVMNRH
ncbi:MAG: PKD-like domain-containing protein, partial [Cyclobacteriaceae bacterium]